MKTLRFDIKIPENGIIKLPENHQFLGKEAEVIILIKEDKNFKKLKAADFVKKWAGVLKNDNVDENKFNYLSQKYE